MEEKAKKSIWVNFNLLNKPVYLAGFDPVQAMVMLLIIAVFLIADPKLGLAMAAAMLFVGARIRKENSLGNPGFIDSYIAFLSTRKNITDTGNILGLLERNK